MIIALGSDHGGYELKQNIKEYLEQQGFSYKDYGSKDNTRTDYPIYAEKVAKAIQNKECDVRNITL